MDIGIEIAVTLQRLYPGDYALDKIKNLLRHEATLEAIRAGSGRADIVGKWGDELAEFKRRRAGFLIYK